MFAHNQQETAQLEAKAYELEQTTALAAEAKAALDSWVRYEGQVKIRQQKELSETIMAKIQKELENPKVLQQILQQSVADVESKKYHYASYVALTDFVGRDRSIQGTIEEERDPANHRFPLSPPLSRTPVPSIKQFPPSPCILLWHFRMNSIVMGWFSTVLLDRSGCRLSRE
jgi:hypothetical protein